MSWKNATFVLGLIALAACEGTPVQPSGASGQGRSHDLVAADSTPSLTVAAPSVGIASVRALVPGLFYAVRGMTQDNTDVHIIVRSNPTSTGFQYLTSGTLVQDEYRTSGGEMTFSTTTGHRYLVTVAPSPGGMDDLAHASYVEFNP